MTSSVPACRQPSHEMRPLHNSLMSLNSVSLVIFERKIVIFTIFFRMQQAIFTSLSSFSAKEISTSCIFLQDCIWIRRASVSYLALQRFT